MVKYSAHRPLVDGQADTQSERNVYVGCSERKGKRRVRGAGSHADAALDVGLGRVVRARLGVDVADVR